MNRFLQKLNEHRIQLRRSRLETLQLNLGRKCNQACRHCHVDAAPWRTEMMSAETAARIASWIRRYRPPIIDITGGAPELNPNFRLFVQIAFELNLKCIDRNNLTILEEPGFDDLPQFLADHQVEIIASLPCYLEKNVNQQRGNGVFEKSIHALRKLNALGYGVSLPLHWFTIHSAQLFLLNNLNSKPITKKCSAANTESFLIASSPSPTSRSLASLKIYAKEGTSLNIWICLSPTSIPPRFPD